MSKIDELEERVSRIERATGIDPVALAADEAASIEAGVVAAPLSEPPVSVDVDAVVRELVHENDRAQLDYLAGERGVDDPGSLPTKEAVAQAIADTGYVPPATA